MIIKLEDTLGERASNTLYVSEVPNIGDEVTYIDRRQSVHTGVVSKIKRDYQLTQINNQLTNDTTVVTIVVKIPK